MKLNTIKLFVVIVALALALFAAPAWAQPSEETQDEPPEGCMWVYGEIWCPGGGGYPTCADITCGACEQCRTGATGAYCWQYGTPGPGGCESDLINHLEPDPLRGDPAFLRKLGVGVPDAPACATTATG